MDESVAAPGFARRLKSRLGALGRSIWSDHRHLLFELSLAEPPPQRTPSIEVEFLEADASHLARIHADPAHGISPSAARLHHHLRASGSRCMIGVADGRIVYRGWTSTDWWRIAGPRRIRLGPDTAVIYRCFTVKDYRRKGIYAAALGRELARLRSEGIGRIVVNVDEENAASIRGVEGVGFRRIGRYRVLWMGGLVRVLMDPDLRSRVQRPLAR